MSKFFIMNVLLGIAINALVLGQDVNSVPCLQPEHADMSFLLGTWDVTSKKRISFNEDTWEESSGLASWQLDLEGCLFKESWSGTIDGKSLKWVQWLALDHRNQKWQQSMVDSSHGNIITSEGYFTEDRLILTVASQRKGRLLI